MSEKIEYEVREETPAEPKVILTVTVDDTGRVSFSGKATDHSTLKALGVELVCMSEREKIKAAL